MKPDPQKLVYHFRDYLDQLLGDIENNTALAAGFFRSYQLNQVVPVELAPFSSPGFITFADLFHVCKESFPPVDQLSKSEISVLSYKLQHLLAAWHFHFDFPNLLPDSEKYKLMVDHWNTPVKLAVTGESHIEICHSDTHSCPYSGYCTICDDLNDE